MPHDDDRPSAMLAPQSERIQSYLRTSSSTDDIVREVTTAFASDVARILGDTGNRASRDNAEQAQRGQPRRGR